MAYDPARTLVDVCGLLATLLGVGLLAMSSVTGLDVGAALRGIASQLPTTLLPALGMLLASALNILAGASLMRVGRWAPFTSVEEALVAGSVGAIVLDLLCLFILGPLGLFAPIPLSLLVLLISAAGMLLRPWFVPGVPAAPKVSLSGWLLVALVWAAPLLLQLASPVPPGVDVLPDQVAPIAHLHLFGSWETLSVLPSPIYGPASALLGYTALLGVLSQLTGLSAPLTVAAFALPLTLLVAAASRHLVHTLVGGRGSTGLGPASETRSLGFDPGRAAAASWVLLTVPLTFAFLRVPEARASVLALVPTTLALTVLVGTGRWGGRSRPIALAMALGTAMMVSPLIGLLGTLTVLLIGLGSPARLRLAMAGALGGSIMALPQLAAMLGGTVSALLAVPVVLVGLSLAGLLGGRSSRDPDAAQRAPAPDMRVLTMVVAAVVVLVAVVAAVVTLIGQPGLLADVMAALSAFFLDWWVLLLAGAVAVILVRGVDAWRTLLAASATGIVVLLVADTPARLLGEGSAWATWLSAEVPRAASFWLPWMLAIAGGLGMGALWERRDLPSRARVGLACAFVILAGLTVRGDLAGPESVEQHHYSESLAIALQAAQGGYWVGHPDTRLVIDAPRAGLVAAIEAEVAAGRWGPSTAVLHVAPSFQQWEATPLGVFAGVLETDVTPDPERGYRTVGGRLRGVEELPGLLGPAYPYLVIEGEPDSSGYLAEAAATGYREVWRDARAVLLRRAPS